MTPKWKCLVILAILLSQTIAHRESRAQSLTPTVRGIYGVEQPLIGFRDPDANATVLVFLDPYCPVIRQYSHRLRELHTDYNHIPRDRVGRPVRQLTDGSLETYGYPGDQVCILGIYATPDISLKDIAAHAIDAGFPFRVLHDHRQECMRAFGVKEVAEVVVLDANDRVVYQGTIDNQFFPGGAKPAPTEHYLRDVLDRLTSGQVVKSSRRPPQGCHIPQLAEQPSPSDQATFHGDIEPILRRHCQRCHRPGEVGPMPLISYEQTLAYADMIEEVVLDQRMPPWPGQSPRRLVDEQRLTDDERFALLAWIRGGRLRGDRSLAPPAIEWPSGNEWRIGKPDLILEMSEPFSVPATGLLDYVYFTLPADFPEDRYIRAIETLPGAPNVVHHIQVHEYPHALSPDENRGLNTMDRLMLYGAALDGAKLLGSFTPGNNTNARSYGTDTGMKLSRGANLLMELHYTPNGRKTLDRSRVGIIFADNKPQREIQTHYFLRKRGDFVIPANAQHHTMQQLYHFETPVRILSVRPHMHLRGKSYRLELVDSASVRLADMSDRSTHLDPKGEVVLTIPIWDFNWQRSYEFETPIVVPRGKALLATAFWDNTRHNPRNPNCQTDVPWGQQIHHEMFNTLILYETLDDEATTSPLAER